jgi:hypothetical protein
MAAQAGRADDLESSESTKERDMKFEMITDIRYDALMLSFFSLFPGGDEQGTSILISDADGWFPYPPAIVFRVLVSSIRMSNT